MKPTSWSIKRQSKTWALVQSPSKWHLKKYSQALFDCSYCPPGTCICRPYFFSFPALLIIILRTSFVKVITFSDLLRARLHETRSELKLVWNLKPLWNVVSFTGQFTWKFYHGNFQNNSKTLLHMCKWYLLINVDLINAKQMLRYWLFFKQ